MMRNAGRLLIGSTIGAAWAMALQTPGALYSNCAKEEVVAAAVPAGASIRVVSSIDGENGTCYRIEVTSAVGNALMKAAFFDGSHPAIVAYRQAVQAPPQAQVPVTPVPAPDATLAAASAVKPPRLADLSGRNFHDSKRFDLRTLKGKLLVVHFWQAADDPTVRDDAEFLAYLRTQYGQRGVEVVGITAEERVNKIKSLIEDYDANWPLIRDSGDLAGQYGVTSASEVFLLRRGGKILLSGPRADDFEQRIVRELRR